MITKTEWPYKLNEVCVCGRSFGFHSANPPHTNMGSEEGRKPCGGFRLSRRKRSRK